MPAVLLILRFVAILVFELVAFFFFYNRPEGRKAVYFSWYAWIIDALAIFSGSMIMFWSVYALHHPRLFTSPIPSWVFWTAFLIGSWQMGIHFIKIIIRVLVRHRHQKENHSQSEWPKM